MLALAGAADYISAILRSVIVLTATPDEMRGRVTGIELRRSRARRRSATSRPARSPRQRTCASRSSPAGSSVVGTLLIVAAVPAMLGTTR